MYVCVAVLFIPGCHILEHHNEALSRASAADCLATQSRSVVMTNYDELNAICHDHITCHSAELTFHVQLTIKCATVKVGPGNK